jgi:hypothetical protein
MIKDIVDSDRFTGSERIVSFKDALGGLAIPPHGAVEAPSCDHRYTRSQVPVNSIVVFVGIVIAIVDVVGIVIVVVDIVRIVIVFLVVVRIVIVIVAVVRIVVVFVTIALALGLGLVVTIHSRLV